jgi:hypothetical protein
MIDCKTIIALCTMAVIYLTAGTTQPTITVTDCVASTDCYVEFNQQYDRRTLTLVTRTGERTEVASESIADATWSQLPYGITYAHQNQVFHTANQLAIVRSTQRD